MAANRRQTPPPSHVVLAALALLCLGAPARSRAADTFGSGAGYLPRPATAQAPPPEESIIPPDWNASEGDDAGAVCDGCAAMICRGESCGGRGGAYGLVEATFFRYHRTDGVRVGDNSSAEDSEFDFEIAPRLTVGYVGKGGLGMRVRWWDYNHTQESREGAGSDFSVDACTADLEMFDTLQLGRRWRLEYSSGMRYSEFDERMLDAAEGDLRVNNFHGMGGVMGLELRREMTRSLSMFARIRGALLMDDKKVFDQDNGAVNTHVLLRDSVQGMVELSVGYRYEYVLSNGVGLFAQAAGEYQDWFGYSSAFNGSEAAFAGDSDVGFGGLMLGIGMTR